MHLAARCHSQGRGRETSVDWPHPPPARRTAGKSAQWTIRSGRRSRQGAETPVAGGAWRSRPRQLFPWSRSCSMVRRLRARSPRIAASASRLIWPRRCSISASCASDHLCSARPSQIGLRESWTMRDLDQLRDEERFVLQCIRQVQAPSWYPTRPDPFGPRPVPPRPAPGRAPWRISCRRDAAAIWRGQTRPRTGR